jgi:hypothetical integral membrane protein (TIGR02206 family)
MTRTPYLLAVVLAAAACGCLCVVARRRPGAWSTTAARALSLLLVADAVTFVVAPLVAHDWRLRTSLPLALCDVALVVAAAACWSRRPALVELTYFWGLAGTLQAVVTPDLSSTFPHLEFFEYVVGHLGIVVAALFLVVGMRITPRPHAVWRVLAITAGYTLLVGLFDAATGSDYMFLAQRPRHWSLLSVLGPWPWYVVSAAAVAVPLLLVLDAPFARARRRVAG